LEEVEGERGGDEGEDAGAAAGLAHNGHAGFIAAKRVNMFLNPMDWGRGGGYGGKKDGLEVIEDSSGEEGRRDGFKGGGGGGGRELPPPASYLSLPPFTSLLC